MSNKLFQVLSSEKVQAALRVSGLFVAALAMLGIVPITANDQPIMPF